MLLHIAKFPFSVSRVTFVFPPCFTGDLGEKPHPPVLCARNKHRGESKEFFPKYSVKSNILSTYQGLLLLLIAALKILTIATAMLNFLPCH